MQMQNLILFSENTKTFFKRRNKSRTERGMTKEQSRLDKESVQKSEPK